MPATTPHPAARWRSVWRPKDWGEEGTVDRVTEAPRPVGVVLDAGRPARSVSRWDLVVGPAGAMDPLSWDCPTVNPVKLPGSHGAAAGSRRPRTACAVRSRRAARTRHRAGSSGRAHRGRSPRPGRLRLGARGSWRREVGPPGGGPG